MTRQITIHMDEDAARALRDAIDETLITRPDGIIDADRIIGASTPQPRRALRAPRLARLLILLTICVALAAFIWWTWWSVTLDDPLAQEGYAAPTGRAYDPDNDPDLKALLEPEPEQDPRPTKAGGGAPAP